jgi:hypothetical protein
MPDAAGEDPQRSAVNPVSTMNSARRLRTLATSRAGMACAEAGVKVACRFDTLGFPFSFQIYSPQILWHVTE